MRLMLTADAVGGVWQHATDLAAALAARGDEIVLAVLGPPPAKAERARVAAIPGVTVLETGLPLDWLADDPVALAEAGRALAALARAEAVALVQLNHPALAADARFDAPVIAVAHSCLATWWQAVEQGPLPADFAWRVAAHAAGLAAADRVVVPSRAFAAATAAAYALRTAPRVVLNGRAMPAPAPAPMHDFAFTAGRLWDRGKNLATLDRAAARLGVPIKAAGPLEGPNGEVARFANLATIGRLEGSALAHCLAARPVFVSAARYEPFGLAVLEAAQAGCALVLSDIPTFRELWGDAACFVAPDDPAGFAAAIEGLIGHVPRRRAMGERARAAAGRYTVARMADGMRALQREVLAGAAARAVA